jgi:flagellar assembly protein FliH
LQDIGIQTRVGLPAGIEAFEYPAEPGEPSLPDWDGWAGTGATAIPEKLRDAAGEAKVATLHAEFDRRLAEETRRAFEAGREKGRQEGHSAEREAQAATQAAAEERRVRQAAELIENFAQERDRYLRAVEHEVVELALAIAARILRREAQMDPLLLTGAVRVALGQLVGTTQVRLLVPSAELDLWSEAISLLPNLALKPAVLAGEGMRLGDCVIETELGTVDLGIRAQMGEIERGFFDRAGAHGAEQAPAPAPGADMRR